MNNPNRVEVVFQQELAGRNALHFWIGAFVLGFGIYFWWTGMFSACCVEFNAAPAKLESSYYARQSSQAGGMGDGMGSTGAVSILFDTICLIGWGSLVILTLMRRGLAAILERLGFVTGGLYQWAALGRQQSLEKKQRHDAPTTQPSAEPASSPPPKKKEAPMVVAMKNHERRLRQLESKTQDIPLPPPPPKPKTVEEQLAEQGELIEKLQEELAKK